MRQFDGGIEQRLKNSPMIEKLRLSSLIDLQIFRFAIIGGITAGVYVAIYTLLITLGSISGWLSVVISYLLAISFQYVGHALFTFRRSVQSQSQFLRFAVLNGAGLCFALAITEIVTNVFSFQPFVAGIIVVVLLPVMNFVVMRIWVYV